MADINCVFVGGPANGRSERVSFDVIHVGPVASRKDEVTYVMACEVRTTEDRTQFLVPLTRNPLRKFLYQRRAKGQAIAMFGLVTSRSRWVK